MPYSFQKLLIKEMTGQLRAECQDFLDRHPESRIDHSPDWQAIVQSEQLENLFFYLVRDRGVLCGLVPVVIKEWPLDCRLGEIHLFYAPLMRLCILGEGFILPEVPHVLNQFIDLLAKDPSLRFDAIWLETLPVESPYYQFLQSSDAVTIHFRRFMRQEKRLHHRIRLPPTFQDYMNSFSGRHRGNLLRNPRKLANDTNKKVHIDLTTNSADVDRFITEAVKVSRKTYQWHLLQRGLQDPDALKRRLHLAAERGWLRSYLLKLDEEALAFMLGTQYNNRFEHVDIGYDYEFGKYRLGNILQILVMEDLFQRNPPRTFEFGIHADYKAEFGNESYEAVSTLLFRPTYYNLFAANLYRLCQMTSNAGVWCLDRIGGTKRIKNLIRRLSIR